MDYQTQEALNRKADIWKVEELQRKVDNMQREYNSLQDDLRRLLNGNSILHEALRQTLNTLIQDEERLDINGLTIILNQL